MAHFIEPEDLKTYLDITNNIILCNFTNFMTQKSIIKSLPKMILPSILFKNIIKKNINLNNIYPSIEFSVLHQRNESSYIILYDDNTTIDNYNSTDQIQYFYNYFLINEKLKVSILSGGLNNWIQKNYDITKPLFLDDYTTFDETNKILFTTDDINDTWINDFIKISGCCFLKETLKNKDIHYILNVSEIPTVKDEDLIYLDIPMKDNRTENLLNHLPKAFEFIDKVLLNNEKILVHCQAGISRSVSIVMAWIIWNEKKTVEDTYEIIKLHRPQASPNLNFWIQLQKFYTTIINNPNDNLDIIIQKINLV